MKKILPISSLARKHQSSSHELDFWFLGIAVFISMFGLLMVYDASQFEAYQSFADKYYFVRQQSISLILGIGALVFFTFFDYHRWKKFANIFLFIALLLLILVFIPGLGKIG